MALNSDDMKNDLVAAIVANDSSLTQEQITKMTEFIEKISIATTEQIKRGTVTISSSTYNVN